MVRPDRWISPFPRSPCTEDIRFCRDEVRRDGRDHAGRPGKVVELGQSELRTPVRHNGLMVQVVVFHSAYGLRQAEADTAAHLRAAGHEVITPACTTGRPRGPWMPSWP